MISAGSSMSRPRDNSYRNDGAHHATGEVAQDHRVPGAPFCACSQGPGTIITRDRPATLALRATERPLTGRFAGPGTSGPAQRGVATGRTGKCRSPPVTGVPANPAWQAAARPMRFDLLNVQIFSPRSPVPGPRTAADNCQEPPLIILGVILLIIGFITQIAIVWTIGIIAVVAGIILALLGMAGHAVGGRRHYF